MHKKMVFYIFALSSFLAEAISAKEFDYQYHLDWLPSYSLRDNENMEVGNESFVFNDLRGDLKLSYLSIQSVLRPRLFTEFEVGNSKKRHTNFFLSEAFVSLLAIDDFQINAGRQSYQWGPAELVSWSNTLFHFNYNARSFFYKEDGKYLVKANYSPNKNVSWILMSEVFNDHLKNDKSDFSFNRPYQRKILLKGETFLEKTSDYVGMTFSSDGSKTKSIGFYGNTNLDESFSFYTDSRLTSAPSYYKLTNIGQTTTWKFVEEDIGDVRPLISLGARYEGEIDLRFEYIYNSIGLSASDLESAISATHFTNPYFKYNSAILGMSGRELLGKNYFYTSLRIPNLGENEDLSLYFRHFYSLQDKSSTIAFLSEKNLSSSLVGYLEAEKSLGDKNTELTILNSFVGRVGVKWSY